MADALISPAVGGTMWAVTAGLIAWCARKVRLAVREDLVPMMGVLGAFVFAAQMVNFSIPGTGSSGHLGGGLMLAILLGPHAAFLVIASILAVQAFFFADGGLLALGCNIFNLGFFPAFVAYPFVYRVLVKDRYDTRRAWGAAVAAAVVGLQFGALSVVLETVASGISGVPLGGFVLLMLPIHLAIGVVEGLATAVVVAFVARARPEAMPTAAVAPGAKASLRPVLVALLIAAAAAGGIASWFASTQPDGLEWSLAKITDTEQVSASAGRLHEDLAAVQEKTAFLPDYEFKAGGGGAEPEEKAPWPPAQVGTSVAGLVGGLITLGLAGLIGLALRRRQKPA